MDITCNMLVASSLSPLREQSRCFSPSVTWGIDEGCLQTPALQPEGPTSLIVSLREGIILFILSYVEQADEKCLIAVV